MIDCGFSIRETTQRLAKLGKKPEQISAILVTHEHSDHWKGVVTSMSPPAVSKVGKLIVLDSPFALSTAIQALRLAILV